jgi:hypothetical protein
LESWSSEKLDRDFVRPRQHRCVKRLGGHHNPSGIDVDTDLAAGTDDPLFRLQQTDSLLQLKPAVGALEINNVVINVEHEKIISQYFSHSGIYFELSCL